MEQVKTITYKLNRYGETSDLFYTELSVFTNEFYKKNIGYFSELLVSYRKNVESISGERVRSDHELFFELLSIGVFWNNYNSYALGSNILATELMSGLYNLRRSYKPMKAEIDNLRGKLSPALLLKEQTIYNNLNIKSFGKLINWLEATGEFREEVLRFRIWQNLFRIEKETAALWNNIILSVKDNFLVQVDKVLAKYTPEVDNYIKYSTRAKFGEEDYIFCKRPKTDYYLNMVGAELMNMAFRESFLKTDKKALLLPACMRRNPDYCMAEGDGLDMVCTGCDKRCNIFKYRALGEELGFEVRIIPHSSDFSQWLEYFAAGKNIGVIGVACILNLITGGLEMRKLNIPAQCVFLDYCGCKAHWDVDGIPTDLNVNQLKRILGKPINISNRQAV